MRFQLYVVTGLLGPYAPGNGQSKAVRGQESQTEVWEVRRSTIEYTRIPGEHAGLAGWEDAAVAPDRLGDYIRDYCALVSKHGYHTVLSGHFGQGCMPVPLETGA
jgi:hypothetical protein